MNQRQEKILEYINHKGRVSIHDLIDLFQMSEQTIRNDLRLLENKNKITRIHGGAVKKESLGEAPFVRRIIENSDLKMKVGIKALDLIEENDVIFFDAGTSILALIEQIPRNKHFIAFTHALHIASALSNFPNVETHVIGGLLNHKLQEITGPKALNEARTIKVNKFFLSLSAFDSVGVYENHLLSSEFKKTMLKQARSVIAVADSSKENIFGLIELAKWEDIDILIIDEIKSAEIKNSLVENNVCLIT